ncbi:motility associated factor glycosyltransferase family protein [Bacillus sp. FJAT-22090]|uniref:motility associated factor glycosyltransferase family protein n=1 Tax=Bacillus sp. FJAT-22090 TaxID=1581038 RepID=UPI0009E9ACBD|nr:6-hydroxymethylpterin diphosphokinase MptE-like protein [Bacillus sp. FJAT-22090]
MKFEIEKVSTKTGGYTLKVNGFFLHSKYNPEKEAIHIAELQFKKDHIHILFGNGLGYISEKLMEKINEKSKLLVVDPLVDKLTDFEIRNNGVLIKQLTNENFGTYLGAKLNNYNRNVTIICSPNYDRLFPHEYKELLKIVTNQLNLNIVNENTMRYFAETWQSNYVNNLLSAKMDYSINILEKKFNCPVVIASGGPSLTKQIPLLKENIDKIILIAAGSTINTLLSHEIEPDYVISIDGGEKNYEHFQQLNLNKSHLIYSMTNHHKIRRVFHSGCLFFLSNEFVNSKNIIEYTLDKKIPIISGGGSVANYAFSIASYISTGPIALIGQDLAYTSNKTHAVNNRNYKEIDEQYKEERGMFYTKGYNNEDVLTDYAFLSMKDTFERLVNIVKHENAIYNCTEGGVNLEGYKHEPFNSFCNKYALSRIQKDISIAEEIVDYTDFIEKIKEEVLNYNKIINNLNMGLRALANNKSNISFTNNTLGKLKMVDSEIEKLFFKVSMSTIIEPISIDILKNYPVKEKETAKETFDRIYNQNKELYSRLLDAAKISKEYTVNLIEKINEHVKDENNE